MSVDFTVENQVAVVRINRPESHNAIDPETRGLLNQAWERLRSDREIRAAVITGAGEKSFCAGIDLKKTMPDEESFASKIYGSNTGAGISAGLDGIDKPLIAAVNGYALGGGLEIALACDIRLASENATFALPEVKVGSMPGSGGTQRLPRAVGVSNAMYLMLTGDRIDAAEALRIGLVTRVVPQAQLLPLAMEMAKRIAANAPLSITAVKRLVYQGMDMPLTHGLQAERNAFGLLYASEDRREGRLAFAEKRKPAYKGR